MEPSLNPLPPWVAKYARGREEDGADVRKLGIGLVFCAGLVAFNMISAIKGWGRISVMTELALAFSSIVFFLLGSMFGYFFFVETILKPLARSRVDEAWMELIGGRFFEKQGESAATRLDKEAQLVGLLQDTEDRKRRIAKIRAAAAILDALGLYMGGNLRLLLESNKFVYGTKR